MTLSPSIFSKSELQRPFLICSVRFRKKDRLEKELQQPGIGPSPMTLYSVYLTSSRRGGRGGIGSLALLCLRQGKADAHTYYTFTQERQGLLLPMREKLCVCVL